VPARNGNSAKTWYSATTSHLIAFWKLEDDVDKRYEKDVSQNSLIYFWCDISSRWEAYKIRNSGRGDIRIEATLPACHDDATMVEQQSGRP